MLEIAIPSRDALRLEYLVLDVNGTIALDGQLIAGVGERLDKLSKLLGIWLVSADTQGTLASLADNLTVKARLLQPGDKAVQKAALGIAVLGGEGLSAACWEAADVIVPDIGAALDLLLRPPRLIATLRA
jgi:soluble P-type ATPase